MRACFHALLIVLIWAVPAFASARQDDEFETKRTQAQAVLITNLNKLASWCNGNDLFLERDRVYRQVLELDPDNLDARKGLRYSRQSDGSWQEAAARGEVKNMNEKALAKLPKRTSDAVRPYAETLMALIEKEPSYSAKRQAVYDELLTLDPDNELVHKARGEVLVEGKWVLPETVGGKARREEIKKLVKSSKETLPPVQDGKAEVEERILGVEWASVVTTPSVRILSTGPAEEAREIARAVSAAGPLLKALLGLEAVHYPTGYTIYILENPGEKESILAKLQLSDADRERLFAMQSAGIPQTNNVIVFEPEADRRLDCSVRHTIGHLLARNLGVKPHQAWAWEGLGLYLTRELVGTRLTWFVGEEGAASEDSTLRAKLMSPDTNWIAEAYSVLVEEDRPDLVDVLKLDLNKLGTSQMLVAYALVAYLLEGRPKDAAGFLQAVGSGAEPNEASRTTLKLSLAELQLRIKMWLEQRG
jgi:hypothetical protein